MFSRTSRYRNVPQSPHLTGKGEYVLSENLRIIPQPAGTFLHQVHGGDRLDLLAFQYYQDPTRWWVIADGHPEFPFPEDLLNRDPMTDELLAIDHVVYEQSLQALLTAIRAFATADLVASDLLTATVAVTFAGAPARSLVLSAIALAGFHLLSSFPWSDGPNAMEAFTCEHPGAKAAWNVLMAQLSAVPGVEQTVPAIADRSLALTYNRVAVSRDALVNLIGANGFVVVPKLSQAFPRPGSRIAIPPNQVSGGVNG
jgi:hypothetical protein